uniref:Uncharacterized protein n=1 Tax=Ananas comosus var. bracteatus TaxID=296719 RepID=A0A6V7NT26_ANACO|nr:unnamed protein product [Ananas comosus var. bracteatus]
MLVRVAPYKPALRSWPTRLMLARAFSRPLFYVFFQSLPRQERLGTAGRALLRASSSASDELICGLPLEVFILERLRAVPVRLICADIWRVWARHREGLCRSRGVTRNKLTFKGFLRSQTLKPNLLSPTPSQPPAPSSLCTLRTARPPATELRPPDSSLYPTPSILSQSLSPALFFLVDQTCKEGRASPLGLSPASRTSGGPSPATPSSAEPRSSFSSSLR